MKCRDIRLHQEKYRKENMELEFRLRETQTKERCEYQQTAGSNEYNGDRPGFMADTDRAERESDRNDIRYTERKYSPSNSDLSLYLWSHYSTHKKLNSMIVRTFETVKKNRLANKQQFLYNIIDIILAIFNKIALSMPIKVKRFIKNHQKNVRGEKFENQC